jgi:hypothetical protein
MMTIDNISENIAKFLYIGTPEAWQVGSLKPLITADWADNRIIADMKTNRISHVGTLIVRESKIAVPSISEVSTLHDIIQIAYPIIAVKPQADVIIRTLRFLRKLWFLQA